MFPQSFLMASSFRPACARRLAFLVPILALLGFIALNQAAYAATRTVPAQYATIQVAINAAQDGDTVLVADGIYTGPGNVDVDFSGKNIIVTSQHGPASTIIDCQASAATLSHRGFIMQSGELNATLSGFTVKNGYQVQNNSGVASGSGGGIYLGRNTPGSSLTVSNCIITHCVADSGFSGGVGGGIYAQTNSAGAASTITISNCTITNNSAVFDGGGIHSSAAGNGTITITGCTITSNTAADPYGSSVGNGGGVLNTTDNSTITVSACTIANNTAAYKGGGVCNTVTGYGTIAVNSCTLTGNSAGGGGGANDFGGTQTVTNCSFTGNSGGGLYNHSVLTLNNVILYGDTGGEIDNTSGQPLTLRNCDVQGGYAGTNNINANPKFVNAPTDLHLQAGSPCIGAGLLIAGVLTDKDGKTRPNPPSIGAYEGTGGATLAATTTTLTGAPNPSLVGQAVTLTVQASNGTQSPPTGTVELAFNGAADSASLATLDNTGQVVYTLTGFSAGTYAVTATYSGDASNQASSGSVTQIVNAAPTHLLWNYTDGTASLWTLPADASSFTYQVFGPYTGWNAKALADAPDGTTHLLWTHPADGQVSLYNIAPSGALTHHEYGPYPGWTASSVSTDGNGLCHLLWHYTDGTASLWALDNTAGTFSHHEYGPYPGWTATAVASGPTTTQLLWNNTDGTAAGWIVNNDGSFAHHSFGPYPSSAATALSVGPDDGSHLLWSIGSGQLSLWTANFGTGGFSHTEYGPYPGAAGTSLATGPDGVSHLLWTYGDGTASLWGINPNGSIGHHVFGPYSGWNAVAVSAGP